MIFFDMQVFIFIPYPEWETHKTKRKTTWDTGNVIKWPFSTTTPKQLLIQIYLLYRLRHLEKHQQMPKSAHFSLGNIIYFLFIGFGVHFGTCNSLFPCFNYFLLEHCDGMCSGLFICCKMFICNIIKLIFFSVPWEKARPYNFEYYSTSTDCLRN